jgi:hypothetical protein
MKRFPVSLALLALLLLSPLLALAQGLRGNNTFNELPNDASTGTTQYRLAKMAPGTAGKGKAILAATTDTAIPLGIVTRGQGVTGIASITWVGQAPCEMDATNASGVANQPVVASVTTAGRCHTQAAVPSNGMVIGRMVDDATTAGSTALVLMMNQPYVPGSVSGSGVNTGIAHALAYYAVAGTVVDDLPALPTLNRGLIGDGTDWITSAVGMGGAGACNASTVVTAVVANAAPACNPVTSARVDTSIAVTGAGINTSGQPVSAPATFAFQGTASPSTLAGDIDNYGSCTAIACRINGGATDRNVTGLVAPATDGDLRAVCNIGTTNALVLRHQATGSSAANRFLLTDDVTLRPDQCHFLRYDLPSTRWRSVVNTGPDYRDVRPIGMIFGDPGVNSAPLSDDNDTPNGFTNVYGHDLKILSMACWADAGSPTVRAIMTGGTATSILTADCTCGSAVWAACSVQTGASAPIVHSFTETATTSTCSVTPCSVDFQLVTAGGTAKYVVIKGRGILQ